MSEHFVAEKARELTFVALKMNKEKSLQKINKELEYIYKYIQSCAEVGVFIANYSWRDTRPGLVREEIDILMGILREDGYNIGWVDPSKHITIRW